ncbi:MAG: enoyl-CoA hydratase/isomerase family protein [Acidobacteria bacterium]|nr:enoyl-CoA hydratase/isomerase family protein [Acidobacteriota bacterium]
MSAVTLTKRPGGVAVILFDTPGSPVNILSRELFGDFAALLDQIEHDPEIKACVLASAKKDFIAGANLKQFYAIEKESEGEELSRAGHALIDRIADSRKPFVAAISGLALGGGLEVALACHYRLAADDPSTALALPEVQLGLLPAAGGTQRLPQLVGLPAALPMMLTGQRVRARKAYRMGLVDALTTPGGIVETAARAAIALAGGSLKPRKRKKPLLEMLLESAPGRAIVFRQARAGVMAKTRGLYPAPLFIIDCVRTGYSKGTAAGFDRESVLFGKLTASAETKSLIGLFNGMTDLKKPIAGAEPRPVRRLGILGGGFMGQGIASVSLKLAPVIVKDVSDESLGKCGKSIWEGLSKQLLSGSLTKFERDRLWTRFQPTTRADDLAGTDLIIEAVFEDLVLKRKVLAEVEAHIPEKTVFASNTSALPIGSIAAEARCPERVLGMHYFSPVPKMPLLELIVAEKTAPWAVATARAFGVQQGKTVIVVKDGPGFYTTRILSPYMNEAMVLLEEGARIEDIDRVMKDFGYPVGPLALLDEVGIDVGAHVSKELGQAFVQRGLGASVALPKLFEAGYHGRKNGRGFYHYVDERKKPVNTRVYRLIGGAERRALAAGAIADRLSLLMVNEAVYCLQEGIITSPRDGDVGAILGLGFPPFRGGPFRYIDSLGAAEALRRLEALAVSCGPRFHPAPMLADRARDGKKFYPCSE